MPLGIEQNNHLSNLTLDVWRDQIFFSKGTETYFAFATHACFTSEDFWVHIRQLFMAEIEKLTIFPTIVSACVFARSPKARRLCSRSTFLRRCSSTTAPAEQKRHTRMSYEN